MWKKRKVRGKDLYIIYDTASPTHIIHRIVETAQRADVYLSQVAANGNTPPSPVIFENKRSKFGKMEENLSDAEKHDIAEQIKTYDENEVAEDYRRLVKIGCDAKDKSVYITTGNKVVDKYTFDERLNTTGRNNLTFFEFWENIDYFTAKPNIATLLDKLKAERKYENEYTRTYNVYRLYYGSVSIFKPLLAMEYYCMFKPRTVLDFTMGWGGRLVGACALNIHKYIGIDSNTRLEAQYAGLVEFIKPRTTTQIELVFEDAKTVDYSKYEYDMVFTSPPYYNIEKYNGGQIYKEKGDWDELFYFPVFYETHKHLKNGGVYCLNISVEIYERVCVKLFGEAKHRFNMKKHNRHNTKGTTPKNMDSEFVYVWVK